MDIPSGTEIAHWFQDKHARRLGAFQGAEGLDLVRDGSDYCYVWLTSYVDMDYEGYYLLEVRTSVGAGETRDFLVVRSGIKGVACEWWQHPINFGASTDDHIAHLREGLIWFAEWITTDLEESI